MCHAFQLLLHLSSINLNIGILKSAQSCYGSHRCPLPELNPSSWKVCDWYQVKRKPRQVFRLLHTNVLLPCKLMDVACVTSATCARPTLLYTYTYISSFGSQCACGIFPFISADCVSSSRCCLRKPGSNPGYDRP